MIVYEITNTVTGRSYIGMSNMTVAKRWWHHKNSAQRGSPTVLHNSIRLHGAEAFTIVQIATLLPSLGRKELGKLEQEIIAQRNSRLPHGYNMTIGGDGHLAGEDNILIGRKASPEKIAKVKASWTPERKARHAETMHGLKGKPKKFDRVRASLNRKAWWAAHPERHAEIMRGIRSFKATPQRNERIRVAQRKLWSNPEYRAKRIDQYRLLGQRVGRLSKTKR